MNDYAKCLVKGCNNRKNQGVFIGDLCKPCYNYLTTGNVGKTESFLNKMSIMRESLRIISVADWKTSGELRKIARDSLDNCDIIN